MAADVAFQNNKALNYGLQNYFEVLFMWETLAYLIQIDLIAAEA